MHWKYSGNRQKVILLAWLVAAVFLLLIWPEGSLVQKIYDQLCPYTAYCMDAIAYGREGVSAENRVMDMVSRELPLYSYSISYYGNGMMNEYYKEYVEILVQEAEEGGNVETGEGNAEKAEGDTEGKNSGDGNVGALEGDWNKGAAEDDEEEDGIIKELFDKFFGKTPEEGNEEGAKGQNGEGGKNTEGLNAEGQDMETGESGGPNSVSGTEIAEPEETQEDASGTEGERLNEEDSHFVITDGSGGNADKEAYKGLIHSEKKQDISLEDYQEFEKLVNKFYTVDSNTYTTADELNAERFSSVDLKMEKNSSAPQILIYHTHSQEGYADSVPGDASTTVIGVGEQLAEILRNEYGYQVLHHTGTYDVETRDYAYSNALPELEKILAENPSIEVVIDLHRDSVAEGTRLVTEIGGVPAARFMFFNGLSRVREVGEISYLPNENLQQNLAFSFQMQKVCEEYYPGLTRKIYLKGYRYNMHVKPRTLLVEMGAQNNTLQEALNACGPLARVLDMVLGGA